MNSTATSVKTNTVWAGRRASRVCSLPSLAAPPRKVAYADPARRTRAKLGEQTASNDVEAANAGAACLRPFLVLRDPTVQPSRDNKSRSV